MKLLVFSDSHGNVDNMALAVERERPDHIFHLGDGWQDAERIHDMFPGIPLEQVPGNCDFRMTEPAVKLVSLGGKRILLCHGHTYRVKEGLMDVGYAAREQKADLLCFGHTHVPTQEWAGESLLLNPGSIVPTQEWAGESLLLNPGSIGYWGKPTYAVVKIEDGRLTADLRKLV